MQTNSLLRLYRPRPSHLDFLYRNGHVSRSRFNSEGDRAGRGVRSVFYRVSPDELCI